MGCGMGWWGDPVAAVLTTGATGGAVPSWDALLGFILCCEAVCWCVVGSLCGGGVMLWVLVWLTQSCVEFAADFVLVSHSCLLVL